MIGFLNTSSSFSLGAIQALQELADTLYIYGGEWMETPLPTTLYDVTDYGLVGNGTTDDTSALNTLALNTSVTNWYFPSGSSFLLSRVDVPSHVEAIFGGGTIISKGYTGDTNPEGAFNFNNTGKNLADNFVCDGLTFQLGSGFDGGYAYGQITFFQYGGSTNNVQIRNCYYNQSGHSMNAVKVFAHTDGSISHTGLRIYNNEVVNQAAIAFEIYNQENLETSTGFVDTYLYNNKFTNGSGMSISVAGVKQNFYIYNNEFRAGWAIETAECDNGFIHHNYGVGLTSYAYTDGIKWSGPFTDPGVVKVYNNHFEGEPVDNEHGGTFLLYNGGPTEVYDNYIRGATMVKLDNFDGKDTNLVMGDIHNNTFVMDWVNDWSNNAVKIFEDTGTTTTIDEGTFRLNDVYNSRLNQTALFTSCTGQTYSDNNFYTNGGSCIVGATQTGGSCNQNYVGTPPTSRVGAGLSDPANIGPQ